MVRDSLSSFSFFNALHNPLGVVPDRIADSSSRKAVSFSSACTTKRFPSSRCASAIQNDRPLEINRCWRQPPRELLIARRQ